MRTYVLNIDNVALEEFNDVLEALEDLDVDIKAYFFKKDNEESNYVVFSTHHKLTLMEFEK